MYKPNFCTECGAKLLRLRWHLWTSRKFCDTCARGLRKPRLISTLVVAGSLLVAGFVAGRARRPNPPPLIIVRRSDSPLNDQGQPAAAGLRPSSESGVNQTQSTNASGAAEEVVYLCGARTKKGTPCSRRVREPVRCWQHKGMPAMLPQEKLLVKD